MPTDNFYRAFVTGGGPVVECDFCGREYFSTTNLDDEDLADFEKLQEKNPSKYIAEPYDAIDYCELGGRKYVCDCPCNAGDGYEKFIWSMRDRIIDYLNVRTEEDHRKAVAEKQRVDEAIEVHTKAKRVALALVKAEKVLSNTMDYM